MTTMTTSKSELVRQLVHLARTSHKWYLVDMKVEGGYTGAARHSRGMRHAFMLSARLVKDAI